MAAAAVAAAAAASQSAVLQRAATASATAEPLVDLTPNTLPQNFQPSSDAQQAPAKLPKLGDAISKAFNTLKK